MLWAWCLYCFFPMETQQCIVPVLYSSAPRRSLCLEQAPAVVSLGTDWNGKEINKLKCFQECIKSICETQPTHWGKGNVYNVVWERGVQKELASATESSYLITKASQIPVPGIWGTRKSHCLLFLSSSNLSFVFKIIFNSLHLEGLSSN